ncbi:hypothetical protein Syun_029945 [Stephania yunnanensis]|uniref:F-box domain-containing protein n=1 Tax=Stephania yunnanensis TaxID=152371 RepID=A0AAP0E6K8_9MAGN
MESLPHEILIDIVSRVPITSLMQFKCVSKASYSLAQDHYLLHMYATQNNSCIILQSEHSLDDQLHVIGTDRHQYENLTRKLAPPFKFSMPKFNIAVSPASASDLTSLSPTVLISSLSFGSIRQPLLDFTAIPRHCSSYLQFASAHTSSEVVRCPCRECLNIEEKKFDVIESHLYAKGISQSYTRWINYGEQIVGGYSRDTSQDVKEGVASRGLIDSQKDDYNSTEYTRGGEPLSLLNPTKHSKSPIQMNNIVVRRLVLLLKGTRAAAYVPSFKQLLILFISQCIRQMLLKFNERNIR